MIDIIRLDEKEYLKCSATFPLDFCFFYTVSLTEDGRYNLHIRESCNGIDIYKTFETINEVKKYLNKQEESLEKLISLNNKLEIFE